MGIDIAAIAAAPTTDASTSAEAPAGNKSPAGKGDAFGALLDKAACESSETDAEWRPCDETDKGKDEDFDELAALAITSLLSIDATVPQAKQTKGEELAAKTDAAAITVTNITDRALVADPTAPAEIVDASMSSQLTARAGARAIGKDMGAGEKHKTETVPDAIEKAIDATSKTMPTDAGTTTKPVTPQGVTAGEIAKEIAGVGLDLNQGPSTTASTGRADAAASTGKPDAAASTGKPDVAASTGKPDAEATVKARPASAPKSSAREKDTPHKGDGLDFTAAQASSSANAKPAMEAARGSDSTQQAAGVRVTGSTAARFARAMERAGAQVVNESANAAGSAGPVNSGGSRQQSSNGEATPDHAARLSAAIRQAVPNVMAFTVNGPIPIDTRVAAAAVADASGPLLENAPGAIPERDVIAQLVQSMRVQFRDGIGEAVLKLKPEHLGSVHISLRIENGAIKATVHAEAPAVRQWLESQQDTLRTGLADQGLRLERFVVEPDGQRRAPADDARDQRDQRRRQQRRRIVEKDQPAFEITV